MEIVIKNLPSKKNSDSDGFMYKFYQILKREIMPILYKIFKKIEEGIPLNSSYKANITMIPKPGKGITRKLQTNISH